MALVVVVLVPFVPFVPVAAIALLACEGVPDLHFTGADAGGSSSDAGAEGVSDDAGSVRPDATSPVADSGPFTDAAGHDAAAPPVTDATASGSCPNDPPAGTTCCGAIVCKGAAGQCQCNLCGMCTTEGFCCPGVMGRYATCATSLDGCPNGGF